jgi:acyl-CoA thioesterase FadM
MDINMHMNNSAYLRVCELTRWRLFPQTNLYPFFKKIGGVMWVVADQKVQYYRAVPPLTKYLVSTTLSISDNKWIQYHHQFQQDPATVKPGKSAIVYADVYAKTVIKRTSGETVRPSELMAECDFIRSVLSDEVYESTEGIKS